MARTESVFVVLAVVGVLVLCFVFLTDRSWVDCLCLSIGVFFVSMIPLLFPTQELGSPRTSGAHNSVADTSSAIPMAVPVAHSAVAANTKAQTDTSTTAAHKKDAPQSVNASHVLQPPTTAAGVDDARSNVKKASDGNSPQGTSIPKSDASSRAPARSPGSSAKEAGSAP